jgi:hypothetical protein
MIIGLEASGSCETPDQGNRVDIDRRPSVLASLALAHEERAPLRADVPNEQLLELADAEAGEEHDPAGDEVLQVLDREEEAVHLVVGEDLRELLA